MQNIKKLTHKWFKGINLQTSQIPQIPQSWSPIQIWAQINQY
jgi:hypothetical protein